MSQVPQAAIEAAAAAMGRLPAPDSRFELDRWHIIMRVAIEAAAPHLAYAAGPAAEERIQAAEARCGELAQLARDMLGMYRQHADVGVPCSRTGWVDDAMIAGWEAVLDGGEVTR